MNVRRDGEDKTMCLMRRTFKEQPSSNQTAIETVEKVIGRAAPYFGMRPAGYNTTSKRATPIDEHCF